MNDQTTDRRDEAQEPVSEKRTQAAEAEASELARRRDPSLKRSTTKRQAADAVKRHPGVEWVRPSDLIVRTGARVAGRGIDLQTALARRSRHGVVKAGRATGHGIARAYRVTSDRARKLPPASAFGRGSGERYSWVTRTGIGLG